LKVLVRKPPPFALSLSKGHLKRRSWFAKLTTNGEFRTLSFAPKGDAGLRI